MKVELKRGYPWITTIDLNKVTAISKNSNTFKIIYMMVNDNHYGEEFKTQDEMEKRYIEMVRIWEND